MADNSGVLGLLIRLQADASQLIEEMRRGEAATVEATEGITRAQVALDEEYQRASDLQSQFDAERLKAIEETREVIQGIEEEHQAILDSNAAVEQRLQLEQLRAEQKAQMASLKTDTANREETAGVVQAIAEQNAAILANNSLVEQKALLASQDAEAEQILSEALHQQAVRLREIQAADESRAEVAEAVQVWEERRAAAIMKSAAAQDAYNASVGASAEFVATATEAQVEQIRAVQIAWMEEQERQRAGFAELAAIEEAKAKEVAAVRARGMVEWNEELARQKEGAAELAAYEKELAASVAAAWQRANLMMRFSPERTAELVEITRLEELQKNSVTGVAEAEVSAAAAGEDYVAVLREQAVAGIENEAAIKAQAAAYEGLDLSVRGLFPTFVNLRTLVRVATGIFAIGFIISEWKSFTDAIEETSLAMGGFGEASQKAFADNVKASDEALTKAKDLTTAYRNLQDIEHQQSQLEAERNAALQKNLPPLMESMLLIQGITSGNLILLRNTITEMKELHDVTDKASVAAQKQVAASATVAADQVVQARSTIEVLRAQADELDSSGQKAAALALKLKALHAEENAAIHEAGTNQSRVHDLHEIYAAREIELKNQIAFAGSKINNTEAVLHDRLMDNIEAIRQETASLKEQAEVLAVGGRPEDEQAGLRAERMQDQQRKILEAAQRDLAAHKITRAQYEQVEKDYADAVIAIHEFLQADLTVIEAKAEERENHALTEERGRLAKEQAAAEERVSVEVSKSDALVRASEKETAALNKKAAEEVEKEEDAAKGIKASIIARTETEREAQVATIAAKNAEEAAYTSWAKSVAGSNAIVATSERQAMEAKIATDSASLGKESDPGKRAALQQQLQEDAANLEKAKQRESASYALAAKAASDAATVTYNAEMKVADANIIAEAKTHEALTKIMADLKARSQAEEDSLDRLSTPHAVHMVQVLREIEAAKKNYDATMRSVAAAHTEAEALRTQAMELALVAATTTNVTQKTNLLIAAVQKLTQATALQTAADKAEHQAKIESAMAEADAVESAATNLLTTLGYKKQAAIVDAIMQTADGIAALAIQDYEGAALHFLSAAEYGIVAGQTPSKGSSVGANTGGEGSGGRAPGSSGPLSAGATGSETPMEPGLTSIGSPPPGGTLHVMVVGPNEAAQWMAGQLNILTTQKGGQLIASRSINPPKAGR